MNTSDHIPSLRTALVRIALCVALALSLIGMSAPAAFADVQSTDIVSGRSVEDRGLSVGSMPDVDAESAVLFTSDGTILWERNIDEQRAEASITKLMTAIVALENADLSQTITITSDAFSPGPSESGLQEGAQLSLDTLLHDMLISSDNDAAEAIAIGVGGSEGNFVGMMNDKAAALGMSSTHFTNPHGLEEDGHYTTARDLTILVRYAMQNDTIRSIVRIPSMDIDVGGGTETIENTNDLLTTLDGCIGIKTGTEDSAGYCVAVACERDGLELYCVVLGSSSDSMRFQSATELMEWGYAHYVPVTLSDTTTVVAQVPHSQWMDRTVPVACETAKTAYVLDYDNAVCQNISTVTVTGDVKKGDCLGTITWTQGDRVVGTARLVATEDVDAPNFLQRIGIWFLRTFTSRPDTESLQILVEPIQIQDPSSVTVS